MQTPTQPPARPPILFHLRGASAYIRRRTNVHISTTTMHRWASSGLITANKLGSRWQIPQQTLEELVSKFLRGEDAP
jgi:hypothetical protein